MRKAMYTVRVNSSSSPSFRRSFVTAIAVSFSLPMLCHQMLAQEQAAFVPLSVNNVVDSLIRNNAERARNLLHSEAVRVYHLTYRGFPGDREAEMTVQASYDSPATKDFKVLSQTGSKIILERVFKKLLESEQESVRPDINSQTRLDRENYEFTLVNYEPAERQYVLRVSPKRKSKFVYRGKIWVDGSDFAVTRIEAEPAQNPSFWTKKSEIHHEYQKIQNFWLPAKNQSISYIRLGGRATLTIEYKDYRLTAAHPNSGAVSRAVDVSPPPVDFPH